MHQRGDEKPGYRIVLAMVAACTIGLIMLSAKRSVVDVPGAPTRSEVTRRLPDGRIDVNRASAAELRLLPGLGEILAQRIIDDREVHGRFDSSAELARVRGIGERTIERMQPFIVAPADVDHLAGAGDD